MNSFNVFLKNLYMLKSCFIDMITFINPSNKILVNEAR